MWDTSQEETGEAIHFIIKGGPSVTLESVRKGKQAW